ncbi:hypothetical protein BDV96DRAFT_601039 [Lophiotrema nucula]|uniref:Thymidylate kinase n=1 Tax=Lophiotrema nucula TaxID=690887 RepID=A0A6A5Z3R9_9PLEO|nr:hypothetical protein BDV96DRAFT_601039 [Lophiotrema nucula]
MALASRQPFAEIGSPRLQALSSAKNRQNAIAPTPTFNSPLKPTQSTGKRRAPAVFDEDDLENVDPSIFNSPSKKSKTIDGFSKPSKFSLVTSPSKPSPSSVTASPSIPSVRKALSSPNTSNSTPISLSRGSPKHKRVGLLSKRRTSSSPFRRVDPPSFSHSSPGLPFSIDAALSGTISSYTPKAPVATPTHVPTLDESMPKSWFFEIHEDTPEQEAANLMEHSASVLDISSDDDVETKKRNEELERGKENIPPPDFFPSQTQDIFSSESVDATQETLANHVRLPRLRKIAQDAMDEDRSPLGDLPAADFYGEGLDANSYVTVDATIEKPSGLSKEFDFSIATPKKEPAQQDTIEPSTVEESIQIFADETATNDPPILAQAAMPVAEVASEPQEVLCSAPS